MTEISRRTWLGRTAALAAAAGWAPRALAGATPPALRPSTLRLEHLHTGEKLTLEHFPGRPPDAQTAAAFDRLLRDFRTGEVGAMDADLLDQLARLVRLTGSSRPFEVISGFRSNATNETLRQRSGGVARASLHLQGRAIDVRVADVSLPTLRDAAVALASGGVGFYPGSNFVHLDTGRVRRW